MILSINRKANHENEDKGVWSTGRWISDTSMLDIPPTMVKGPVIGDPACEYSFEA